jgi:tRNA wybutosine-synthesizing protein 1
MDNEERIALPDAVRGRYEKAVYGIAGRHSGVQICAWTKKALRNKGVCYKQRFYGVDCHRCCQMSPSLAWCQQACVFCWRPMEWMKRTSMESSEVDAPEAIIGECVAKRRKLIGGIGGAKDVRRAAFDDSFGLFPSHWAISLSGEPTIYPKLGELVKALRKHGEVRSIFIVTNGQESERLRGMAEEGALPTQLYVSLTAPDEALFKKINRSRYDDGWARLNRTLELLPSLGCRRVIRLTLIKGVNDAEAGLSSYARLLEKSQADFIEIKSYMHLGLSRQRLGRENMAPHNHVLEWAGKLLTFMPGYRLEDDDPQSRIALLKRKDSPHGNIIKKV